MCQVRVGRERDPQAERRLCFWSRRRGHGVRQVEGPVGPEQAGVLGLDEESHCQHWWEVLCMVASTSSGVRSLQFWLFLSIRCGVTVWAPVRVKVQPQGVLQSWNSNDLQAYVVFLRRVSFFSQEHASSPFTRSPGYLAGGQGRVEAAALHQMGEFSASSDNSGIWRSKGISLSF